MMEDTDMKNTNKILHQLSLLRMKILLCVVAFMLSSTAWAESGAWRSTSPLLDGVDETHALYSTSLSSVGQTSPYYVPAASGDLQPFGVSTTVRHAPPSTGGGDPENPKILLPLGDWDWVCWCGALVVLLCTVRKRKKTPTRCAREK